MKQIFQHLKTGRIELIEVPCPKVKPRHVLVRSHLSLISPGTERMLMEFGRAGIVGKMRQQPDKVRQVLDKVKAEGFYATFTAVKSKLDDYVPLGYCNVGTVIETGSDIKDVSPGDLVITNGPHAEVIEVPKHLCIKLPPLVDQEAAVFSIIGAIGLQGIRLASPSLGEHCGVIGLGLVGLLTAQLLKAQGCRVIGFDYDHHRLNLAKTLGIETIDLSTHANPVNAGIRFSRGYGLDAVFITTATHSQEPMENAAQMCRQRGKIVLIGVSGMKLSRDIFYKKELSFQVSCSYGPGRYDSHYEEQGEDYPYSYVRWTEQRNIMAILDMISEKKIKPELLISHRVLFENYREAFQLLSNKQNALGILLKYRQDKHISINNIDRTIHYNVEKVLNFPICVGFIGAGNFAKNILIPEFQKHTRILSVASISGTSCAKVAIKYGIPRCTTDVNQVIKGEIDAVVIATQHDSHSRFVCQALNSNKHVFVEKPLCLSIDELNDITEAVKKNSSKILMVGFNRRFAPLIQKIKSLLESVTTPKCFIMTINAGYISGEHWTQDSQKGGGRIVGECCHFVDLLRFLSGNKIVSYSCSFLKGYSDTATITLSFEDGSMGTIHYFSNGHRSMVKERLEIYCDSMVLKMDNYQILKGYGWKNFKKKRLWKPDKGYKECINRFIEGLNTGKSPIDFDQIKEISSVSIQIAQQLNVFYPSKKESIDVLQ